MRAISLVYLEQKSWGLTFSYTKIVKATLHLQLCNYLFDSWKIIFVLGRVKKGIHHRILKLENCSKNTQNHVISKKRESQAFILILSCCFVGKTLEVSACCSKWIRQERIFILSGHYDVKLSLKKLRLESRLANGSFFHLFWRQQPGKVKHCLSC